MSEKSVSRYHLKNFILPLIIAAAAFAVFANALSGEFVYDDTRQIVQNPLIQNSSLYGRALASDVWAFKGDGAVAGSNYYRPTFVVWLILNFNVFGLNPFGWHLMNVLLHVGVCLLAFFLIKKWTADEKIAFAIGLVFAVHPVHTETVAWISGSPDLLFGLFFLAALWFAEKIGGAKRTEVHDSAVGKSDSQAVSWIAAVGFYALALGAKEVALLCFPVFYLIFEPFGDRKTALKQTLLFAAAAAVYFAARFFALGALSLPNEDGTSFSSTILTIPSMLAFYLKQTIFPLWLGANYPLRPVTEISFAEFVLPLLICAAVFAFFAFLARRSFVQKVGFAIFVLSLLPALNATAFAAEQIVHDRYLYLPLLGFLMLVVPAVCELLERFFAGRAPQIVLFAAAVCALPLAAKTFIYNRVWLSDSNLWQHAVTIDEKSAFNWSQLGAELSEEGRTDEAVAAYRKSLDVRPTPLALMGIARGLTEQKNYDEAVGHLRTVVEMPNEKVNAYTLFQVYEALAVALTAKNDSSAAQNYLTQARRRLPLYTAALTEKLAVVLYLQNRKPEALRELENVRNQARAEFLPASKTVFLRLGMLYAEAGRRDEAKKSLQEYLNLTADFQDKITIADRRQAAEILKSLS